jgi:AcrR family transcriptional regulator
VSRATSKPSCATSKPSCATAKRSYRSPAREHRARATRERILAAARTEFLRLGHAATTIGAVAAAAGVSVPAVELAFGTKPQLLRASSTPEETS